MVARPTASVKPLDASRLRIRLNHALRHRNRHRNRHTNRNRIHNRLNNHPITLTTNIHTRVLASPPPNY